MSAFQNAVYTMVSRIPGGKIASYGGVAALLGKPRAARAVGAALSALPEHHNVPWWRVVNRNGEISTSSIFHTAQVQRALLEGEGVTFGPGK